MKIVSGLLDFNITKIFSFGISPVFVDRVFDREESYEGGMAPTWRDIISNIGMDECLVEFENIIETHSFEKFSGDRDARSSDDRHIPIEGELDKNPILDDEEYLNHIRTHSVGLSVADHGIGENSFVRRVAGIFDNQIRRSHMGVREEKKIL